MGKWILLSGVQ